MGTEVLRPQDCLIERIRVSPCRRRNNYNVTPSYANSNPRFNRKPAVRSDRSEQRKLRQQQEPSVSKRSSSVDDLKVSRSHNHYHHQHGNGQNLLMEKVTILRRGESLDSKIKSSESAKNAEIVVAGTDRLGPDPRMVPKQIRITDLRSPLPGKCDVYAGSAFAVSPAPSSLPLPSFSKKKHVPIDDSATRDLRRRTKRNYKVEMEDIRKIGLAYFANLSGEKKEQAEEFLNKMFGSRHEIGFKIYQKFVRREGLSRVDTKGCFKVLDVDGNERLNREEAKPLYYISEINILFTCDICHVILTGSFFSCFQCFSDPSEETFDLCCDCYKNQRFRGRHDHTVFYDNQRLLLNHRDRRQQRKRNDLQLTAEIYYQTIFPDIKDAADKIFLEMDNDKNKKIDEDEYISYMKKKGYPKMANINVFRELNGSGSGQLDSMEVMTLNYIIQCRIPICDGCNIIMDGLYFTCIKCFNDRDDKTFDVCPSCFKKKKYSHKHKKFFDNHSLLQCKRIEAPEEKKRNKRMRAQPSTSTSEQMVSARQQTIRLLSATSSLTGIAASVVTIITSCSIM